MRSEICDVGLQSAVPSIRPGSSMTRTAPAGAVGAVTMSLRKIQGCPCSQRAAPRLLTRAISLLMPAQSVFVSRVPQMFHVFHGVLQTDAGELTRTVSSIIIRDLNDAVFVRLKYRDNVPRGTS